MTSLFLSRLLRQLPVPNIMSLRKFDAVPYHLGVLFQHPWLSFFSLSSNRLAVHADASAARTPCQCISLQSQADLQVVFTAGPYSCHFLPQRQLSIPVAPPILILENAAQRPQDRSHGLAPAGVPCRVMAPSAIRQQQQQMT